MKKPALAIIGLSVALLLVAAVAFAATRDSTDDRAAVKNATTTASPTPTPSPSPSPSPAETDEEEAAIIAYSGNGFEPSTLTVSAGTTITVRNESSRVLDFASDVHPTHRENPELNIGTVAAGESKTFAPQQTGSWGVHNHELPSHTMVLVVQ